MNRRLAWSALWLLGTGCTATTCAVLRDGHVSCWGAMAGSEWGAGSLTPVVLGGLSNIVQISLTYTTSDTSSDDTGCALDADGAVFCWGNNGEGQTGTGAASGIPLSRPTRVQGLGPVRRVDVGWAQPVTCAALKTGGAYCWGNGMLTGPTETMSDVPVEVPSLSDALQVSPSFGRVCALQYRGYLRCWGSPALLGTGDSENTGPVQISGVGTATALSLGLYQTCAINDSRQLICWNTTLPKRVDYPTEFLSLDTNGALTMALATSGAVKVWDMNSNTPETIPELSVQLP